MLELNGFDSMSTIPKAQLNDHGAMDWLTFSSSISRFSARAVTIVITRVA